MENNHGLYEQWCIFHGTRKWKSFVAGKKQIILRMKRELKENDNEKKKKNVGISAVSGMDDRRNLEEISEDFWVPIFVYDYN